MKKNVAIVDGKASHVLSTPSTLSSPPVEEQVEVKLDDKMLTTFLSDAKVFDLWKGVADAGGMLVPYGIKDAAHLEEIINKHRREDIPSPKNGNDLPNAKPASKKKRNDNRNGKRKKMNQKKKREVIIRSGKKKKDAFYYCVPGHYGANQ